MEVVASLSQGRTAAAQCGLFTYKSVPVIFEPPCTLTVSFLLLFCNMCHFSRILAFQSLDENEKIKRTWGKYET